jgi:hypothetical protein
VRTFQLDAEAMPDVGRRSLEIAAQKFPEIVWEHSHVIIDDDGTVRQFCVHQATRKPLPYHGKRVGSQRIHDI